MCCSYDSNFKVMVLKCAEETKRLAVNWEIPHCSTIHDARWEGGLLLKGVNSICKTFCGLKQKNFNSIDEHFLEFVLNNLTVELAVCLNVLW